MTLIQPPQRERSHKLSARELQLLAHVALAERLCLSPLTVKSHLARMARKLGTGDRAGMVGVAFRSGWLR